MLSNEELARVKEKMKKKPRTFGATIARKLGVTKQAVNCVLHQKCQSKPIENWLREWINND